MEGSGPKEIKALENNRTWISTDLLKGKRHILCKWIFTIKHNAYSNIKKFKAHLVVKGFNNPTTLTMKRVCSNNQTQLNSSIIILCKRFIS